MALDGPNGDRTSRVTAAERDELLGLLEAMGMPADPTAELNVQG
jgi:hypothetical protein